MEDLKINISYDVPNKNIEIKILYLGQESNNKMGEKSLDLQESQPVVKYCNLDLAAKQSKEQEVAENKENEEKTVLVLQKKIEILEKELSKKSTEIENLNSKYTEAIAKMKDLENWIEKQEKMEKTNEVLKEEQEEEVEIPGLRNMIRRDLNSCKQFLKVKLDKASAAYKELEVVTSEPSSSILYAPIYFGCTNLMSILLNNGLEANMKCHCDSVRDCNIRNDGIPILHLALHGDHIDLMKLLLSKGAKVNTKTTSGKDVLNLHCAIKNGFHDIVKLLIFEGADVNMKNYFGMTPLHYAINYNCPVDIIKLLVFEGADINAKDESEQQKGSLGRTPLHYAVQNRRAAAARILIECGADITIKDCNGYTPLHFYNNNIKCFFHVCDIK